MKQIKIGVIGCGAWGISLAKVLARNIDKKDIDEVLIFARNLEVVNSINEQHIHPKFLWASNISKKIIATNKLEDLLASEVKVLLSAVPAQETVSVLEELKNYLGLEKEIALKEEIPIIICSKGVLDDVDNPLISDQLSKVIKNKLVVLSGPGFAQDVWDDKEFIMSTLACKDDTVLKDCAKLFSNDNFKLYETNDIIAVQLLGAIKNVIAIGSGILSGMGYSESTRANFLNEFLFEIEKLVTIMGGDKSSLMLPCGIGDLILTGTSMKSRNFAFGYDIGSKKFNLNKKFSIGKKCANDNLQLDSLVEGFNTVFSLHEIAKKQQVNMKICNAVYQILSTARRNLMTKKELDIDEGLKQFVKRIFS